MKFFIILSFSLLLAIQAEADVIFPPFVKGIALSFEGILSYEEPISKSNTINLWGGIGLVSSIDLSRHSALGLEGALELRQYFTPNSFKGVNLDLYLGLANMYYPIFVDHVKSPADSFTGIVPGIKLTDKVPLNSWLIAEPYLSFSTPFYSGSPSWLFTLGLRIGFNKINK